MVRVSETQRNVEAYGRSDELEYQVEKRMREIKTDLEYAAVGNQQSTAGTTSVARTMAGYESWVASNRTSVGTGTNQSTYGYSGGTVLAPVDSTVTGTMTETSLRQVIAACYTAGGDPEILMAGVAIKARMSQVLTGIATRYRNVESGKMAQIIGGADLYVSDFGTHKIVPNRVISRGSTSRDRNILVIDPTYWKLGVLQDWRMKDLAKTGLSDRKIISGEFTLMALNEKSSGKVTDISATL